MLRHALGDSSVLRNKLSWVSAKLNRSFEGGYLCVNIFYVSDLEAHRCYRRDWRAKSVALDYENEPDSADVGHCMA